MSRSPQSELLAQLSSSYSEAMVLFGIQDPEQEPYRSKYECRHRLSALNDRIVEQAQLLDPESASCWSLAVVAQMACVDLEVEELESAESRLHSVLEAIDQKSKEHEEQTVLTKVKSLHQMGLLWCLRQDFERAIGYLERCLEEHDQYCSRHNAAFDLFGQKREAESAMQETVVRTYFHLTQAHQALGQLHQASHFAHRTLHKQLSMDQLDGLDWAINAARLSAYYLGQEHFMSAKAHLLAASAMLSSHRHTGNGTAEDPDDVVRKANAVVNRGWAEFCLALLQPAAEDPLDWCPEREVVRDDTVIEQETDFSHAICLDDVDAELRNICTVRPAALEEAVALFKIGFSRLERSKQQDYAFMHHCTQHVQLCQEQSKLYKYLANFETCPERKFRMFRRRAELLDKVQRELNPDVYLATTRQLLFELGQIYSDMVDFKWVKITSVSGSPRSLSTVGGNVDKLVRMAIFSFGAFLDTFRQDSSSDPYPEAMVRPVLLAHLYLARLWGKFYSSSSRVQDARNSLHFYSRIVQYCSLHPDRQSHFEQELPLCQEMVLLLPAKIRLLSQEQCGNDAKQQQ